MTINTKPDLSLLYLVTTLLLLAHQIDSAYWQEWRLFGIPGGIQVFLGANIVIIAPFLYGLLRMQTTPRLGAQLGLALATVGLGAFVIHVWFLSQGRPEFRNVASIVVLSGALVASVCLGWRCVSFLRETSQVLKPENVDPTRAG
jgi:hypothetical protein